MFEPDPDDPLLAAAAQQLYIQAINNCLQGNTAAADDKLARLGCNWRLSAAVWSAAATAAAGTAAETSQGSSVTAAQQQQQEDQPRGNTDSQQQQPKTHTSKHQPLVLQHDQPLPPELLHCLQSTFTSSSDFWQRHNYFADDTAFFSYILDLAALRQSGPTNALEAAALLLQDQFKQLAEAPASTHHTAGLQASPATAAVAAAAEASYVEWWAHTRPEYAPHQLHFDAAEGAFRRGLGGFRLVHPCASSVLFLTAEGGQTLVLDQDVLGDCQQQQQQEEGQKQQQQQQRQGAHQQQKLEHECVDAAADCEEQDLHRTKRSRCAPSETAPAAVGGVGQAHHHWHHHHQQHQHQQHVHEHDTQQLHEQQYGEAHQQRLALAQSSSLLCPLAGRCCIWPGNRLHGVLPGSAIPLDEQPDTEPSAGSAGDGAAAAAAAAGGQRTTLVLAWWAEDPRKLVPSRTAAAAGAADESAAQPLGPCMSMPLQPSTSDTSGGAALWWMQELQTESAAQLQALVAFPASRAGRSAADTWNGLTRISPTWEQVGSTAVMADAVAEVPLTLVADAAPTTGASASISTDEAQVGNVLPVWVLNHPLLVSAELPCLRFCLRNELEIRRAYVPGLTAWQQLQHDSRYCLQDSLSHI